MNTAITPNMPRQDHAEPKLFVFGDSHSVIWEGNNVLRRPEQGRFKGVKVFHLGEALAYNLLGSDLTEFGKWGQQIVSITREGRDAGLNIAGIMLCFGEIDVRTQIVRRALLDGTDIAESAQRVAKRVIAFARLLYETYQYPTIIWEPIPTTSSKFFSFNPMFPAIGSEIERNYATSCLGSYLRHAAGELLLKGYKIYSFGIFDKLTTCFETKPEFYEDGCHLNLNGLEVAIKQLDKLCEENKLTLNQLFHASANLLHHPAAKDLTDRAKLILSSEHIRPSQLGRMANRGFCFHTKKQTNPLAIIDIGYSAIIVKLIIYNRFDCFGERAKNLKIMVGNDLNKLTDLFQADEVWGLDGTPIELDISTNLGPVRYVVLQLMDDEYFHLGEVRVIGLSFHS